MTFGELLRAKREAAGMSRRALAEKSGVSFGTIHNYETDRRAAAFETVARLAEALGTTCQEFAPPVTPAPATPSKAPPEERTPATKAKAPEGGKGT